MSGEIPNSNEQPNSQAEAWKGLTNYDKIQEDLQADLEEIQYDLDQGKIDQAKADEWTKDVNAKAERAKESLLDDTAREYINDENNNVDDMLASGRINAEQAAAYREEISERAARDASERAQNQATQSTNNEAEQQFEEKDTEINVEEPDSDEQLDSKQLTEQWQSLQPSTMSEEQKRLVQEGIYGLDGKPTKEYLESRAGKKAQAVDEKLNQYTAQIDRLLTNLEEQVKAGAISEEQAQKYRERYQAKQEAALDEATEQIDGYRQDYVDSLQVGIPEEDWIDDSKIHSRDEVLAAHEAEKTGTYLEDIENPTPAEAEARTAEHQKIQQEALAARQAETSSPEQLEALEDKLGELRLELAELFVKKNRIFGPKHRAEYDQVRAEYEEALEQYLNLKSETDEELFQNYLEEDNKLLEDVDNQVDNGNLFRKIISKTLGNDYYKQAMHAHGARSLGVAGAESVKSNPEQPKVAQVSAPESSPEEPVSDETSEGSRLDQIREYFHDTPLDDEGYDIINLDRATVDDEAGQREIDNRIAGWWGGLSDDQKNKVLQYERDNLNSPYGGALRYWLQQQNEL